ncbi:GntR family transcriptional regulator [Salinisphaera hydrothermalis C27AD]
MLARIARGEWRPDKPIPTESALGQEYDVAIGTVRKAVDTLVGDNLLYRSQGRGTFVRRPQFDGALFRFFRQVDAAGHRHVPTSRIIRCELARPPETVRKTLGLDKRSDAVRLDRERIIEADNRIREKIWLPAARFAALVDTPVEDVGNLLYPFYEQAFGEVVASAQETLTIEAAGAEDAACLGIEPGSPVVVIERVARGYDGQPIEYRCSRGRADRFRYQIDIA